MLMRGIFIGGGQFAAKQLEAWVQIPDVQIVGITNRTLEKARLLARQFAIPNVEADVSTLVAKTKPDFVDICTAVDSHLPIVRQIVQLGIPILCQKPIASTLEESRELVECADAANVPLMINDNWRWQCWYREIKRLMDKGVFGHVANAYIAMRPADGIGSEPYNQQPYFREMKRFLVFETGIHYIDTMRYLFGECVALHCLTNQLNPAISGEDQAIVSMLFDSGAVAVWDGNRVIPYAGERPPFNGYMTIEGSKASLRVDCQGGMTIIDHQDGGRSIPHDYVIQDGYRGGSTLACQRHFIKCLQTGRSFETSGSEYLKTMELVFAAYESAENATIFNLTHT